MLRRYDRRADALLDTIRAVLPVAAIDSLPDGTYSVQGFDHEGTPVARDPQRDARALLRLSVPEAAAVLNVSTTTLYARARAGQIAIQRDGRRAFVTTTELTRYCVACDLATNGRSR